MRNKIITLLVILSIFIMPSTASSTLTATPANTQLSINGQAVQGVYINDKLYLPARDTFEKAGWVVDYKTGKTDIYTPEYKLSPYCVYIESSHGTGSGVLVNGKILTAYHVVNNSPTLKIMDYQQLSHTAKLLKYDESLDIALLSTDMTGGVEIGDSNIPNYTYVDLITCPKGVLNVYDKGKFMWISEGETLMPIRSTKIYPGSSGGAVFYQNKLIGIIQKGDDGLFGGFAMPINKIKDFLK